MKTFILSTLLSVLAVTQLYAQTTETFETESGTSFTDNGQVFNITSQLAGPFDIQAAFPGTGWNGTAADNRYIDNDGYAVAGQNVQFTISSAGATPFRINSVWMYLSDHNTSVAVSGSLTVVGKLGGVTQFTATASSGFNTNAGVSNGFSFINFTTFGGNNNTNTNIDQLVFSTGGLFEYVAMDAFTWSTAPQTPTVSTTAASNIGANTATLGGNVSAAGSSSVTDRGIVWATTANPTTSNNKVPNGSGTGTFSGTVSSLPAATLIHFRAYAINSSGTSYGNDLTFTTNAALSATTSQNNVTCAGGNNGSATVTASGGSTPYTYVWSPSGGTGATASNLAAGTYTCTITDAVSASINKTFTITQGSTTTNTFTGASSTAWNNAANWSCGSVPIATHDVVISAPILNMPVISDAQVANNVTIGTSTSLTLNASVSRLQINGVLTITGTMNNNAGTVAFTGSAAQNIPAVIFNKLEISNSAGVTLTGNVQVNDSLKLVNGLLKLGNNSLTVGSANGYTSARYVMTNGTGTLNIQNIGSGGKTGAIIFPVGVSGYCPVSLTNTGTADEFRVRVMDSVTLNYLGSAAVGTKLTSNAVGKTWVIDEAAAGGSNATVMLQWSATDELSGFNRALSYEARYNGTTWTAAAASAAGGSNPYTQSRSGLTSFGVFGVGSGGTLPVELLQFSAERQADAAALDWITASEVNNDHFSITRSADGKTFETIGQVKGKGNTAVNTAYHYTDAGAAAFAKQHRVNAVYYRLVQTDFNGHQQEFPITQVSMGLAVAGDVRLQPNPFVSTLDIALSGMVQDEVSISITDLAGKTVFSHTTQASAGQDHISLSGLDALQQGMYFIHVKGSTVDCTRTLVKSY